MVGTQLREDRGGVLTRSVCHTSAYNLVVSVSTHSNTVTGQGGDPDRQLGGQSVDRVGHTLPPGQAPPTFRGRLSVPDVVHVAPNRQQLPAISSNYQLLLSGYMAVGWRRSDPD